MGHLGQDSALASKQERGGRGPAPARQGPEPASPDTDADSDADAGGPEYLAVARPATSRAKRALDIGLSILVLPLAGVIGLVIAVLVATTSRGPVLFLQERVGIRGVRFRMVKFRTMQIDAEERLRADPELWDTYVNNDFKIPAESDPRLTPVGRWMRRLSLDELPQILNVFTGSMSWVGPRPVTPDQLDDWGADADAYLSVRPGITGWWQVNGRSDVQSMDRIAYDRDYAKSWTFWMDIRILAKTPLKVLHGKGAF